MKLNKSLFLLWSLVGFQKLLIKLQIKKCCRK